MKATQSGARERQALRARIRVALWLALDYESKRAFNALTEIRPEISLHDREIAALYFHAHAVACTKARRIAEGFEAFETSIGVPGGYSRYEVRALDSQGHGIGVSRPFGASS